MDKNIFSQGILMLIDCFKWRRPSDESLRWWYKALQHIPEDIFEKAVFTRLSRLDQPVNIVAEIIEIAEEMQGKRYNAEKAYHLIMKAYQNAGTDTMRPTQWLAENNHSALIETCQEWGNELYYSENRQVARGQFIRWYTQEQRYQQIVTAREQLTGHKELKYIDDASRG